MIRLDFSVAVEVTERGLGRTDRMSAVVSSTDMERNRVLRETNRPDAVSRDDPEPSAVRGGEGTTLLVYRRPSPNLADHTKVRFWCTDVAADVSELVGRGFEFDGVEFGDFKMVDHVLTTQSAVRRGSKTRTATQSSLCSLPSLAARCP